MLYDWKKSENNWYYLGNSNDVARKSGWLFQDGNWYYLGNSEDGVMKTGWINDNGKEYCLYSDSSMIHDCEMYGYRFASDGTSHKLE